MKFIILLMCFLLTGCGAKNIPISDKDNNITKSEPQIFVKIENSNIQNKDIKLQMIDGSNYVTGILKNDTNEDITISNIIISIFTNSKDIADQTFYNAVPEKIIASGEYSLNINVGKEDLSKSIIKISIVTEN